MPKHHLRDFHVHLPPSRRSALAVAASDMIPDIPPRPASLTRSSTLQECWLEPRPHLVHLLLQASKHERLCAAAAKLRPERRRSATPDYAGASMHGGASSRSTGLACVPPHGKWRQSDAHLENAAALLLAEELQSDKHSRLEREHNQRLRCRQASRMHP